MFGLVASVESQIVVTFVPSVRTRCFVNFDPVPWRATLEVRTGSERIADAFVTDDLIT